MLTLPTFTKQTVHCHSTFPTLDGTCLPLNQQCPLTSVLRTGSSVLLTLLKVWKDHQKTRKSNTLDNVTIGGAGLWLCQAASLKETALPCGMCGFGIVHGMLSVEVEEQACFSVHLLCRLAPTNYGMALIKS